MCWEQYFTGQIECFIKNTLALHSRVLQSLGLLEPVRPGTEGTVPSTGSWQGERWGAAQGTEVPSWVPTQPVAACLNLLEERVGSW